jgi:hypothetical protein
MRAGSKDSKMRRGNVVVTGQQIEELLAGRVHSGTVAALPRIRERLDTWREK